MGVECKIKRGLKNDFNILIWFFFFLGAERVEEHSSFLNMPSLKYRLDFQVVKVDYAIDTWVSTIYIECTRQEGGLRWTCVLGVVIILRIFKVLTLSEKSNQMYENRINKRAKVLDMVLEVQSD